MVKFCCKINLKCKVLCNIASQKYRYKLTSIKNLSCATDLFVTKTVGASRWRAAFAPIHDVTFFIITFACPVWKCTSIITYKLSFWWTCRLKRCTFLNFVRLYWTALKSIKRTFFIVDWVSDGITVENWVIAWKRYKEKQCWRTFIILDSDIL